MHVQIYASHALCISSLLLTLGLTGCNKPAEAPTADIEVDTATEQANDPEMENTAALPPTEINTSDNIGTAATEADSSTFKEFRELEDSRENFEMPPADIKVGQ